MNLISKEALEELNELARIERANLEKVNTWTITHLKPLLDKCTSEKEVRAIFNQLQITDEENQIQSLPGNLTVTYAFAVNKYYREY